MSAQLSDVLELAAETVRENPARWLRGDLFRDDRGRGEDADTNNACYACANGMLAVAADVLGFHYDPMDGSRWPTPAPAGVVDEVINDLTGSGLGIENWNDQIDRTPRQVAGLLDEAAEVLREQGQ